VAIDFASSAYVQNGVNALPTGDVDVSLAAWVKITSQVFSVIFGYGDGTTTRASPILYIVNATTISFGLWADDVTYVSGNIAGAWHHWLGTFRASDNLESVYLDGVLRNTKVAGGNGVFSAARCRTGANPSAAPGNFYTGQVQDGRILNRLLGPTEALILASGYRGPLGGEVGWWRYDDFRGITSPDGAVLATANLVPDLSGNENDGTPTTSPVARALDAARLGVGPR